MQRYNMVIKTRLCDNKGRRRWNKKILEEYKQEVGA